MCKELIYYYLTLAVPTWCCPYPAVAYCELRFFKQIKLLISTKSENNLYLTKVESFRVFLGEIPLNYAGEVTGYRIVSFDKTYDCLFNDKILKENLTVEMHQIKKKSILLRCF